MKFCSKCGKELFDEAVICTNCGCSVAPRAESVTPKASVKESPNTANMAMLFAFLIPIVGLIMGIVGACKYQNPDYKKKSVIAIVVSIVVWIASFALLSLMGF